MESITAYQAWPFFTLRGTCTVTPLAANPYELPTSGPLRVPITVYSVFQSVTGDRYERAQVLH